MIYFDNASTTPVHSIVRDFINSFYLAYNGNPSSLCSNGEKIKKILERSRENIANILNAEPDEIFFTGSGSESNTWALKGYANLLKKSGRTHIISTRIEHHSILNILKDMEEQGFEVSLLDVDCNGRISRGQLEEIITENTGLVSIMYVNNEIGTLQPIREIGDICSRSGIIFHTDAVQAVGHILPNVKETDVSMMSFSGHKFNAPSGIGGLYIRKDIQPISPLIFGGQQEFGVRGGTENVCLALAMSLALSLTKDNSFSEYLNTANIKKYLYEELNSINYVKINGSPMYNPWVGIFNIAVDGINGQSLVMALDSMGVCVSTGSACASHSLEPSHVLKAIGLTDDEARSSIRISIGPQNTKEEAEIFIEKLKDAIDLLR